MVTHLEVKLNAAGEIGLVKKSRWIPVLPLEFMAHVARLERLIVEELEIPIN